METALQPIRKPRKPCAVPHGRKKLNDPILIFFMVGFILSWILLAFFEEPDDNPHGFGNGDDETDYEESNPNR